MGAFMRTGLTSINIPNTIYDLYDYAFGFCSQLKTVVLPTHSITLHDSVFYNDINIESIENLEYVILEGMSSQFTGVNVSL
jgi:hypothetical protein